MKEKIVKQFLEEGILLSPDTLGRITESNAERMLERAKKEKAVVFSFQDEPELAIEVRKLQKKQKLSPQDFASYYNARFDGLRDILQKKMEDVVSVANAKKSGSSITTIGMVREQTQRGFIMEDTTGWIEVITRVEDVAADDVIAVKGGVKEEKLFAEEIIWPDIPMSRSHNQPDFTLTLSEKAEHQNGDFLITTEAIYGFDKKKTALPNPGWITISKDSLTVTVLVYRPDKPATQKEALAWLRKRHLLPDKNQIRGTDDPFLIEPIPDVVWILSSERWNDIYKSVIVVSSDGKVPAEVNLATGKVEFKE
jgi:DNA polymerase II small subunit/DNA polymerase delta subunit B